jgi:hypothetical protein
MLWKGRVTIMNNVIKTTEGYIVEMSNGDYACDANGDNTWVTLDEARDVMLGLTVTKQEETARIFGQHYAYVHPNYLKHYERKEIATTFYTPKSKVWYAFIRGMERNEKFPIIAKGAKADIRGVLKRLSESAEKYIENGSWLETLSTDIADAKYIMEHNL